MATRLTAVLAILLGTCPCLADQASTPTESKTANGWLLTSTASGFGSRWCIATYLSSRIEAPRFVSAQHVGLVTTNAHWLSADVPRYVDNSSPVSRIRALRKLRLATLWRGRDSAIVLGLVDDAYLGLRLDADLPDELTAATYR